MKTYLLFWLFFIRFLFPSVLLASAEKVSVRERVLEIIKATPIDSSVVYLEPFIVQSSSIDGGLSREYRELEKTLKLARENGTGLGKFKLPFKFDSVELSNETPFYIPNTQTFRVVHGGIRLSDNATLYFKTGVLWGEERKGKLQFYLPFRYRSSVGIGWKKKF